MKLYQDIRKCSNFKPKIFCFFNEMIAYGHKYQIKKVKADQMGN